VKYLYLLILFFISAFSQAQSVIGVVRDSLKNEPVSYASVRLLNPQDTSYVIGTITGDNGEFKINQSTGKYLIEISYMGYNRYRDSIQFVNKKDKVDLGIIYLSKIDYTLDEAVITAHVPDIIVKGDTIEYNADAYKVKEDALLQDLVRLLPGVDVSADGKLMVNGKVINKILIDGKEFFDNDIELALKNLPASMINKLQIFKEESETSKVTGFKDGNEQQVINLTVKEGYKQRIFGEARTGVGTENRYSHKLSSQFMIDDNQYALIANSNNVTDDFEYSGLSGQYDGITKNQNIGFNFNTQKNEKLKVGGNIKYEHNDNLYEMDSNTRNFIESGDRINNQSSSSRSIRKDLRIGTNLRWTPDTLTTIYARISIGTGTSEEVREDNSRSYVENQRDTTFGKTNYMTNGDTHNLNGSFMFGRKLNNKGRTISFTINGALRGGSSNGINKSDTYYQGVNQTKVIDQVLDIDNNSNSWGIMASFVEPLGKDKSIQLSYNLRSEKSDRDRWTYKRDGEGEYTVIDTAYTRISTTKFTSQRINLSFQSIKEKFEYTVGFNIDPSYSYSKTNTIDSILEQKQNVVNYSPTLRFSYKPKKNITFDFDYYGSTEQPSLRQLSPDTVILSALSRMYGNPDLKPSYQNNLNMYFQRSDYERGSFFTITAGGNYTVNKIVDYTITDSIGNVESTYRNVNGNWGINGGIIFSTPLRNKKITIDNSSYGYLMRNIGFSNGLKNITTNLTMSESFSINYRSEKFSQRLQVNLSYNITRNNLPSQENLNVTNYGFRSSTHWSLPYDFNIQNEISYTRNMGYSDSFKDYEWLWNFSLSKQFLKKKQASVKVQCYDILNQRNNVLRVTSGNYLSDTRTNMLKRYLLFSFSYKFNINPKGSSDDNSSDTYMGY